MLLKDERTISSFTPAGYKRAMWMCVYFGPPLAFFGLVFLFMFLIRDGEMESLRYALAVIGLIGSFGIGALWLYWLKHSGNGKRWQEYVLGEDSIRGRTEWD